MGDQRAPAGKSANTSQSQALRKTAEFEKQPARFSESLPASAAMSGGSWRGIPSTPEQVLFWQQTIGNRAVVQSLQAALQAKQQATKEDDLGANVIVAMPDSEQPRLIDEPTDSQQPAEPPRKKQEEGQPTAIHSKVYWGQSIDIKRHTTAWNTQPIARVSSMKPSFRRGAALGVTSPKAAPWAAIQSMGESGQQEGVRISGPPAATNILTIQGHGGNGTVAWTYFPTGYRAPNFDFRTTDKGTSGSPRWYASPKSSVTAFEGSANAYYPTAGLHKTAGPKEGGKDVYWNIDAAMSTLCQTGEQEHCDDHAQAYRISLKEAEDILTAHVYGKDFGPKPTKAEAEQLVLDTIRTNLTHAGLGDDKTRWAAKYNTLFRKTGQRDTKGWHSVTPTNRRANVAGDVIYDIVTGTSKIGVVSSSNVIKY